MRNDRTFIQCCSDTVLDGISKRTKHAVKSSLGSFSNVPQTCSFTLLSSISTSNDGNHGALLLRWKHRMAERNISKLPPVLSFGTAAFRSLFRLDYLDCI
ncbi:hypothetical protein F2P81_002410 [Scophthalmus maximus]|uniref:Uncharacterized protein n=1 Tax=Scophthalmus maximus TaxID=52904 RepID=A0A6A4TT47_SCOMX|nr:hypothetical protein F2P81_002410 [Scophthalmus maximus]